MAMADLTLMIFKLFYCYLRNMHIGQLPKPIKIFALIILVELCYAGVKNCKNPDASVCIQCSSQFIPILNGAACQRLVENCKQISDDLQRCVLCNQPYILSANQLSCFSPVPFCEVYDLTLKVCKYCQHGYYLYQNTCVLVQIIIPNCQFNADNSNCAVCLEGYILINGNCYENVQNCTAYDDYGNCVQCNQNYNLDNGKCIIIDYFKQYMKIFLPIAGVMALIAIVLCIFLPQKCMIMKKKKEKRKEKENPNEDKYIQKEYKQKTTNQKSKNTQEQDKTKEFPGAIVDHLKPDPQKTSRFGQNSSYQVSPIADTTINQIIIGEFAINSEQML